MCNRSATAIACPNIALIKYWGNCDPQARIPANGSISMNLDGLYSRTTVTFDPRLADDELTLDGQTASAPARRRVSAFLDIVRRMAGMQTFVSVISQNNFPMGAGIASSASGFAALSLAASAAAGLHLNELELSRLARSGSGSACRSVPGGFVEWIVGGCDEDSAAVSIAPPEHWDLVDCVAIISQAHKPTGSTEGHALAHTSPLQAPRVADAPRRLDICRQAILQRDFPLLAEIVEVDCHWMHGVMMTSRPPLLYWQPATLTVMHNVLAWRKAGLRCCYTIDAGPNVHVLCPNQDADEIAGRLAELPGVQQVVTAHPGGPARIIETGWRDQ